jgi:hypothetical protein
MNRDGEWVETDRRSPTGPDRTIRELFAIARCQRVILYCVLFNIGLTIVSYATKPLEDNLPPIAQISLGLGWLALATVQIVFVFLLATKVYGTGTGIAMAVFVIVPCVGLLLLLLINGKATSILREYGVHVGLMGARQKDLEALRRPPPRREPERDDGPPRMKARRVTDDDADDRQ